MTAMGLEARYRRLLRWFPAEHRHAHGEEMLGVLMESASGDRDRPAIADSADLLIGAARIRLRPGRALSDPAGWRDALAIYSIAAPVSTFAAAFLSWLAIDLWLTNTGHGGFGIGYSDAYPLNGTAVTLILNSQGLVLLLVLAGLRRCAALAAVVPLLYLALSQHLFLVGGTGPSIVITTLFVFVGPITEVVALLASAGPRRGKELLRRGHWAVLAAAAIAGAALTAQFSVITMAMPQLGPAGPGPRADRGQGRTGARGGQRPGADRGRVARGRQGHSMAGAVRSPPAASAFRAWLAAASR